MLKNSANWHTNMKLMTALSILLSAGSRYTGRSIAAFSIGTSVSRRREVSSIAFARASDQTCSRRSNSRSPFARQLLSRANPLLLYPMTAVTSSPAIAVISSVSKTASKRTKLNSVAQAETETESKPVEIFRKDYKAPSNWVTDIDMEFDLREGITTVTSYLTISRNPNMPNGDLVLDGDESSISLVELSLGGKSLQANVDYEVLHGKLIIKESALYSGTATPILKTVVEIVPENNTALSGLYKSGGAYCSQCEVSIIGKLYIFYTLLI